MAADTKRIQVTMRLETAAKIEELAGRLNMSDSRMVELLIETAIEDQEWLIKLVSSRFVTAFQQVLGGKKRKPKGSSG